VDLGLKTAASTSDGEKLEAERFYRNIESKIALAQRRGHKRQAKRLPHGGAAAKECLASVFEENGRSVSNDRRGRCERTEACQHADGQVSGNERSSSSAPTSQAHRRCESRKSALQKVA
jgi:hypothetical protein